MSHPAWLDIGNGWLIRARTNGGAEIVHQDPGAEFSGSHDERATNARITIKTREDWDRIVQHVAGAAGSS